MIITSMIYDIKCILNQMYDKQEVVPKGSMIMVYLPT